MSRHYDASLTSEIDQIVGEVLDRVLLTARATTKTRKNKDYIEPEMPKMGNVIPFPGRGKLGCP